MSTSLPGPSPRARSLTGVLPESIAAMAGESTWFAPARSVVIFLLDGLGAANLTARAGHARFLAAATGRRLPRRGTRLRVVPVLPVRLRVDALLHVLPLSV